MKVPFSSLARFYYPVIPEESGDILIFANKTAPIGKGGDAAMLLNIQTNSGDSYLNWNYALADFFTIASQTADPI